MPRAIGGSSASPRAHCPGRTGRTPCPCSRSWTSPARRWPRASCGMPSRPATSSSRWPRTSSRTRCSRSSSRSSCCGTRPSGRGRSRPTCSSTWRSASARSRGWGGSSTTCWTSPASSTAASTWTSRPSTCASWPTRSSRDSWARRARAGRRCSAEPCRPVVGRFDRLKLEQVIGNLLSNAIKYGAGKPIIVRVRGEEEWAVVEVQDHGAGHRPGGPGADLRAVRARLHRPQAGEPGPGPVHRPLAGRRPRRLGPPPEPARPGVDLHGDDPVGADRAVTRVRSARSKAPRTVLGCRSTKTGHGNREGEASSSCRLAGRLDLPGRIPGLLYLGAAPSKSRICWHLCCITVPEAVHPKRLLSLPPSGLRPRHSDGRGAFRPGRRVRSHRSRAGGGPAAPRAAPRIPGGASRMIRAIRDRGVTGHGRRDPGEGNGRRRSAADRAPPRWRQGLRDPAARHARARAELERRRDPALRIPCRRGHRPALLAVLDPRGRRGGPARGGDPPGGRQRPGDLRGMAGPARRDAILGMRGHDRPARRAGRAQGLRQGDPRHHRSQAARDGAPPPGRGAGRGQSSQGRVPRHALPRAAQPPGPGAQLGPRPAPGAQRPVARPVRRQHGRAAGPAHGPAHRRPAGRHPPDARQGPAPARADRAGGPGRAGRRERPAADAGAGPRVHRGPAPSGRSGWRPTPSASTRSS